MERRVPPAMCSSGPALGDRHAKPRSRAIAKAASSDAAVVLHEGLHWHRMFQSR